MKRPLTLAVFVWWLVMLALLVRKHAAPPGTDVALLPAAAASPRDEWFGIYQGQRKVGYARRSVVPTGDGYDVRDDSTLALALLGVPQRVTTSLAAETDAQFCSRLGGSCGYMAGADNCGAQRTVASCAPGCLDSPYGIRHNGHAL